MQRRWSTSNFYVIYMYKKTKKVNIQKKKIHIFADSYVAITKKKNKKTQYSKILKIM